MCNEAVVPNGPESTSEERKRTLDRLLIDALTALQAQETMVPDAKLRQQVVQAGWKQGLDVAAQLAALDRPFSKVLAELRRS